jgi:hypothetical protein
MTASFSALKWSKPDMGAIVAVGLATTISLTTVLESVAVVGAVLSVAGMVTKNKTLSMIGAGLGLVGGVGALASSALGGSAALFGATDAAGGAGAAASAGGSFAEGLTPATAGTVGGAVDAGGFDATFGGAVSTAGDVAATTPDVLGQLSEGPVVSSASDPVAASGPNAASADQMASGFLKAGDTAPTDITNLNTTANAEVNPTGTPTTTAADASNASTTPPPATATGNTPLSPDSVSATNASDKLISDASSGSGGSGGVFSNLLGFVDKHPALAFGAVQAGGTFLSGLTSSLTPAQVAQLNAQAAQNQAAANLTNLQTSNLAMPKSVASLNPVTGPTPSLVPGFINSAPKIAVTGAPA